MITTKLYKLLLFLPFFLSQSSFASDSLKVKKTEYYEDGKLVRATFFDTLRRETSDYKYDYSENFDGKLENEALIVKFRNGKKHTFTHYSFKIKSDSVFFYNTNFAGIEQKVTYDTIGKHIESNYTLLYLPENYSNTIGKKKEFNENNSQKISSLDSLEYIPLKRVSGTKIKYFYDDRGNQNERWYYEGKKITNKFFTQFDSLHRPIKCIYKDKPKKTLTSFIYNDNVIELQEQIYEGGILIDEKKKIIVENEKKEILKREKFEIALKKRKPIGEPKLTFTQENIYENGRIVKIIYEDLQLGKKKVHELKYEFY